jgi:hypothetical protein
MPAVEQDQGAAGYAGGFHLGRPVAVEQGLLVVGRKGKGLAGTHARFLF